MTLLWFGLFALVAVILVIDLGVIHRPGRHLSLKASIGWTSLWFAVGAAFSGAVWLLWARGMVPQSPLTPAQAVVAYLTTWTLELSLSLDNIFVMALIFKRWRIPQDSQHRVLFYGILGAVVFRTLMISLGVELVASFEWLLPVFGAYLVFQGGKALYEHFTHDEAKHAARVVPTRLLGMDMVPADAGGRFLARTDDGKLVVTTMLAALLAIEGTDILFALDSVPAALSVTNEQWIIVSSNVLAIIGLRSLYAVLASVLDRFHELHIALGLLLLYIGAKMIALPWSHIPNVVSLSIIVLLIGGALVLGVVRERKAAGSRS